MSLASFIYISYVTGRMSLAVLGWELDEDIPHKALVHVHVYLK